MPVIAGNFFEVFSSITTHEVPLYAFMGSEMLRFMFPRLSYMKILRIFKSGMFENETALCAAGGRASYAGFFTPT